MSTTAMPAARAVGFHGPVVVAVVGGGVVLPGSGSLPALGLDVEQLELLAALGAAGLEDTATPRSGPPGLSASQQTLATVLRVRGLVDDDTDLLSALSRGGTKEHAPGATHVLDLGPDDQIVLATPVLLRVGPSGFEQVDHDGRVRLVVDAVELMATTVLHRPLPRVDARLAQVELLGLKALDPLRFAALVQRLAAAGLLQRYVEDDPRQQEQFASAERAVRQSLRRRVSVETAISDHAARGRDAERQRAERTGVTRPAVVPVHFQWQIPPLALGLVVAHAQTLDDGRLAERYDFRSSWVTRDPSVEPIEETPAVYLFSHYLWSSGANLRYSAAVKSASPGSVTIHGGPDVPKYDVDLERYFRDHPDVDVAVRNEGEVSCGEALAALADVMTGAAVDLSVLADVPGLAFRQGDRVVRTADRERIVDLDLLPSPYLTGLFDAFPIGVDLSAVIESNRGCPYGCTFCDWGSATASRIRKFSLDRVLAEFDWCSAHAITGVGLADANFGIFERDVEIAEYVADLKKRTGFPRHLGLNYAKNTTKYLKKIVDILVDADILTYGQLSLQSMDPETLTTIKRSNIKLEKYDELASEFRKAKLPLYVDLMMGLPGATMSSYLDDLQQCVDREVIAKVIPTQLLVNAPMNEPEYRATNRIQVVPGELVTSTASFTRADYDEMVRIRRVFLLCEKFGVLRHVARYVRHETGELEVDFLIRLWRDAAADPSRWPQVQLTLDVVPQFMVPAVSWRSFLDEVRVYLIEVLGVADDTALDTVITVQHALLPARQRSFPHHVALDHDYAAWYSAALDAKHAGHGADWPTCVPPLRSFSSGGVVVEDPSEVCRYGIGQPFESDIFAVWDLDSPVSRPGGRLSSLYGG